MSVVGKRYDAEKCPHVVSTLLLKPPTVKKKTLIKCAITHLNQLFELNIFCSFVDPGVIPAQPL